MSEKFSEQLYLGAKELGVDLSQKQLLQFARFAALLESENKKYNLTRILGDKIIPLHFLDSLILANCLDLNKDLTKKTSLMDLGTGPGVPGIPLAIAFPQLQGLLVDSTLKKINFCKLALADLELSDRFFAEHLRSEDVAKQGLKFDLVVSRAVAPMSKLLPIMMPLVAKKGSGVALKGPKIHEELQALESELPVSVKNSWKITLTEHRIPGTLEQRTVVIIKHRA